MKVRHALTGIAAAALLTVGAGAGSASALTVTPDTGATSCTPGTFEQVTKYHGTICYTNTGYDDLRTSGFWTTFIATGCNEGAIAYYDTAGNLWGQKFTAGEPIKFNDWPSGVVSLVWLHISKVTC